MVQENISSIHHQKLTLNRLHSSNYGMNTILYKVIICTSIKIKQSFQRISNTTMTASGIHTHLFMNLLI